MRHLRIRALAAIAILVTMAACESAPAVESATLVLRNGKVVTVDPAMPEAQAVAIRDFTIVAVGSDADIEPFVGATTEIIDLNGRLAIPGFIEGHGHYMGLGRAKMILDLTEVTNFDDIVAMVRDAAAQASPGEWIFGRGWHQEKWDRVPQPNVEGVPLHAALDSVSPDNPVLLTHASGHGAFANGAALLAAEIDAGTPDPAGGQIVRDADGNATGLLRETAQGIVSRASNRGGDQRSTEEIYAEQKRQVDLAGQEALEKGVTSFQDAGSGFGTIDFLKTLEDRGELPVRLYVMVRGESAESLEANLDNYFMPADGNDFLTVRSIKQSIDGALGVHGAWMLEPYADLDTEGHNTTDLETIERLSRIAWAHNFQMNIHAIGDRGNREVLDLYENIFADGDGQARRWRIEHAQHIHPDDVPRFGQLGVIAAMQGVHCTSDAPWVYARLGEERARSGAYVWQDLMRSGAIVTNGTDAPVEDVSPIESFYSTVSRRTADGSVFFPDQRMSRDEALYSYTMANAFAAFEEDIKGSITVGKFADITVLDRDIMTIPEDQILQTRVDHTIVGGDVRYTRDQN
jgi:hypothetical protein